MTRVIANIRTTWWYLHAD